MQQPVFSSARHRHPRSRTDLRLNGSRLQLGHLWLGDDVIDFRIIGLVSSPVWWEAVTNSAGIWLGAVFKVKDRFEAERLSASAGPHLRLGDDVD